MPTLPSTTTTTATTTTTLVPCGAGLLASAEVYTFDVGGVLAEKTAPPPSESKTDSYPKPPTGAVILPIGDTGASGGDTWNLLATAGTARAESRATIAWTIAPCQITASGTFHEKTTGGGTNTSAVGTIEARHQIKLKVKQQVPYTITGWVRAVAPARSSSPTTEFLKCESGSTLADANIQSPTGATIPFEKESSIHPSEELIINCAVVRSSESTAVDAGTDEANLDWSYTITLGQ